MEQSKKKVKVVDIIPVEKGDSIEIPIGKEINYSKISKEEKKPFIDLEKDWKEKEGEKKKNIASIEKEEKEIEKNLESKKDIDNQIEKFEQKAAQLQKDKIVEEAFSTKLSSRRWRIKKYILISVLAVFLASFLYLAIEILPRVDIGIVVKKTPWTFNYTVIASKDLSAIDANSKQIPAEIFSDKKNITLPFPANSKKFVSKKSSGEAVIYNAYSSSPQIFVANTRISSSDGKIFYLVDRTVVPGANIAGGKIVPSSVKVKIIASASGQEYNIGPISNLNFPALLGSEKYKGFYANIDQALTGGYKGDLPYPTDQDVSNAKDSAEKTLRDSLTGFVASQIPKDFKVIEGSNKFTILKEDVNKDVDSNGNFTIFIEAEEDAAAFKENDLLNLISELGKETLGSDFEVYNYVLDYNSAQLDPSASKLSLSVNYNGNFWKPIDVNSFKKSIVGKNENDLKSQIYNLPSGIERAQVSFWPFWVSSVPSDPAKIKIELQ